MNSKDLIIMPVKGYEKMNILRSNYDLTSSGPTNQTLRINKVLRDFGVNDIIVTSKISNENYKKIKRKVIIVNSHIRFGKYLISFKFWSFWKKNTIIIHSHQFRNFQTDLLWLYSKLFRIPFVLTTHGSLFGYLYSHGEKYLNRFYDRITRRIVLKSADAVIVNSKQEEKEVLFAGVKKQKIFIIYPPIPSHVYNHPIIKSSEILKAIFIGRIVPRRRLDIIIRGFQLFLKENQGNLMIIGSSKKISSFQRRANFYKKCIKMASESEHEIKFLEELPWINVQEKLIENDIFIYISDYENLSQPIVEAALCALPIISNKIGITEELAKLGYPIFFINKDPQDLANVLIDINQNIIKYKLKAIDSSQKLKKMFNPKKIGLDHIKIYNRLLQKGNS